MSQRYNDNATPKLEENQLGSYSFCWKVKQRASGREECCWGYMSIYENAPKKLQHLPPKSCSTFPQKVATTLRSGSRKGAVGA